MTIKDSNGYEWNMHDPRKEAACAVENGQGEVAQGGVQNEAQIMNNQLLTLFYLYIYIYIMNYCLVLLGLIMLCPSYSLLGIYLSAVCLSVFTRP